MLTLPRIISHRGANRLQPENTIAAITAAYECGLKWVEFDIQLTADDQLVLMRDQSLQRTTGIPQLVQDFTLNELMQIPANYHMQSQQNRIEVPSLEAVLDYLDQTNMGANIEIKTLNQIGAPLDYLTSEPLDKSRLIRTAEILCDLLQKRSNNPDILISSFSTDCLNTVRKLLPKAPIGLLVHIEDWTTWARVAPFVKEHLQALNAFSLHINQEVLNDSTLPTILNTHNTVCVYTVNQVKQAKYLLSQGVTALFTDNERLHTTLTD